MPVATGVTGNRLITVSTNKVAVWKAPSGTTWLFMESVNFGLMVAQFDGETPIIFPRRSLRVGNFSQVSFSNQLGVGAMYATFRYGSGEPPQYPLAADGDNRMIEEPLANCSIPNGGQIALSGIGGGVWAGNLPLNLAAVWVSNPANAPNSLWVNIAAVCAAQGVEIRPGSTVRIPTSGASNLCISNPGGAPIQAAISYEVIT